MNTFSICPKYNKKALFTTKLQEDMRELSYRVNQSLAPNLIRLHLKGTKAVRTSEFIKQVNCGFNHYV